MCACVCVCDGLYATERCGNEEMGKKDRKQLEKNSIEKKWKWQ